MGVITYYSSLALSLLADSKKKKNNNKKESAKRGTPRRVREGASRSKNDIRINSTK